MASRRIGWINQQLDLITLRKYQNTSRREVGQSDCMGVVTACIVVSVEKKYINNHPVKFVVTCSKQSLVPLYLLYFILLVFTLEKNNPIPLIF